MGTRKDHDTMKDGASIPTRIKATTSTNPPEHVETFAPEKPCFVVAIGASAGGQAALEQMFTTMPTDCGLAFVVAMHLPADGPSFLADMLRRYTAMEVLTAEEGMPLLPNRIHVIPAGRNLAIDSDLLHLETPEERHGAYHPIDRLFQSLAKQVGNRAVAVVLSGAGSDGTLGVKDIKEAGGIVIVQEPESAVYPAMPRSAIATGSVDLILAAEEIPVKIADISRGECVLPAQACQVASLDEDLASIFSLVKAATGHDFSSYKSNTVIRRIERRMAVNDVAGIGKYIALLRTAPQEAHALCQDILIGVTSFFRDPEAFAILHREVFPQLLANRSPEEPLRVWHACCATGEEVYSMAMLIREYLDERKLNAKVLIFATDIDEVAIAQARAGLYGDDIEEDVGEERLKTFFSRVDGRWQVAKGLREMVVFAHQSLIKDPPFSRLDLLVCRNFLIYLNPDMQKRLISLFHQVLKPGGCLFLGSSETVGRTSELFATIDKKWKIFKRTEGEHRSGMPFPFAAPVRKLPSVVRSQKPFPVPEPSPGSVAEKILMGRYSPPCVVVNEKYEIVHTSTRTGRFLEDPVGEPTRDILRKAREELRPALRAAIHKAFAEQKQIMFRGVKIADDNGESAVNVVVEPLNVPMVAGKLVMVIFEPAAVAPSPLSVASPGDETSRDMLVRQLEEQLRITSEQLQATSEQLESSNEGFVSANEELMSINEEFQSANEELQSTNEELETSKEELQALNEELVTVNAELQTKVEELNQTTSDMENLLASSGIATLFLDRELRIKSFTPAAASIFNLIPADSGRPFRHLAGKIDWASFTQDAETVLTGQTFAEREMASLDRERCYLKRIFPYRAHEGRIDGIVVTFIDITERKRAEEVYARLAAIVESSDDAIIAKDLNGIIVDWNAGAERLFGYLTAEVAGKPISLLIPPELHEEEDAILQRLLAGERIDHYETVRLDRDGRRIDVSVTVSPIWSGGQIVGASKIVRDITSRKKHEQQLSDQARLLDLSSDAICVRDAQDRITYWNSGAEETYGYTRDEGLGRVTHDLLRTEFPEPLERITEKLHRDGRWSGELLHTRKDGSKTIVSSRWALSRDAYGNWLVLETNTDITDRKQLEVALKESEQRIRHKLESILSPEGDIGNLDLEDIIDAQAIQSLMDDFYQLSHIPMAIIDSKGTVLVGVGWADICRKFHRVNPETCKNCIECDSQLTTGIPPGEFKLYKCKNNMWDVATPIMVGDRQLGNLFSGQFFFDDEPLDYGLFTSQARKYGFDEGEYIAALDRVPRLSREFVSAGMEFFIKFADVVSKLSYSNVKLARLLTERDMLLESLREGEERLNRAQKIAHLGSWELDVATDQLSWSNEVYRIFGLQPGEFGASYEAFLEAVHPEDREAVDTAYSGSLCEGRDSYEIEHRIVRKSGEVRVVLEKCEHYRDESGRIIRSVGMVQDITERKRVEEELAESEERFRVLSESSPDCIALHDRELRHLYVNPAITQLTGVPLESYQGKTVWEVGIPPETAARLDSMLRPVLETGQKNSGDFVFPTGDEPRYYIWRSVPIFDADGAVKAVLAIASDISARKRAEDALRRAHDELEMRVRERTEELAANVDTLRHEIGERERIETNLNRLNRLYAVSIEIDQAIIRASDRASLFRDFCRIAVEQGGFLLSWVGIVDGDGGQVRRVAACGATGYLDDVEISAGEEPDGIGPTGMSIREGSYCICNDFQNDPCTRPWHEKGRIHGIKASASVAVREEGRVIGVLTLYAGEKDFFDQQHVALLVQMGADVSFALDNMAREVRRLAVEQALHEEALERLKAMESLREKERLLLQQSRLAAMGEMINNIAHQWRQPLNVLGMLVQQMRLFYDMGHFTKDYLDSSVDKSMGLIKHMSQTIDDFRNFFMPDKDTSEFAIHVVVARTLALVEDSFKHHQISAELRADANPEVSGFPNEYSQALLNILMNARDALLERQPDEAKVWVTISREGDKAVVTIADNAGGIPAEIMDRIFDPYFTTKGPDKGTGVGLFMSKIIIEKNMHGRLTVRNTAEGAEFRIEV